MPPKGEIEPSALSRATNPKNRDQALIANRCFQLADSDSQIFGRLFDNSWMAPPEKPIPLLLAPGEGAAAKLGMRRQTLESRIKILGINKFRFRRP